MQQQPGSDASEARERSGDLDIAAIGAVLADPARCRILLALGDGRALPASRLASDAGISAATASSHLNKLTGAGLLEVEVRGRYRYYRQTGPDVADLIEALERFAPALPVRSLRQSVRARALRQARTCYDHLAGQLGVDLMDALIEREYLSVHAGGPDRSDGNATNPSNERQLFLTPSGNQMLKDLGVALPAQKNDIRFHTDSSEQRSHLSGEFARSLLNAFIGHGWLRRTTESRVVLVTADGRDAFARIFGISPAPSGS